MNIHPLKIGNTEARVPVIQGGMGVGVSLGSLAGAVAKEGGIGVISAAQIGFREPDFDTNTKEANLRAIKKEYEKARTIAPEGVIGFNLMVAMRHYEEYVRAAIDAGADIIISGAGLPMDLPRIAGESEVLLAPIISTEK
ncbi:MAG: nitronate monooxygenase, partial [Lachnospiraceae bacterium]|nr:nitronate monooxygenase [Lachnospiraceae bacterium]